MLMFNSRWFYPGVPAVLFAAAALFGCQPDVPEGDDDASQEIGGESPTPTGLPEVTSTPQAPSPTAQPITPTPAVATPPQETPSPTPLAATPTPRTATPTPAGTTPTPPVEGPDIEVSATTIDFGPVEVGQAAEEALLIANTGHADLTFSVEITTTSGGTFSVGPENVLDAGVVPVGLSTGLTVTFAPDGEGASAAVLTILSNDPVNDRVDIPLTGSGIAPVEEDLDGDGYTLDDGDCDDGDPSVYPGALEACDQKDNDCDGEVDEEGASTFYTDGDGDGFGDSSTAVETCTPGSDQVPVAGDCDDTDPGAYPGAAETCDGIDNDCDGDIDEEVQSAFYADNDGDGYGDAGSSVQGCEPPGGYVDDQADCDDGNAGIHPGATEVCDGLDNDCDGDIDEDVQSTFFADNDGDGYGQAGSGVQACEPPSGYVDNQGDCDDGDLEVHPGASEKCDGVDNDCDGATDEDLLTPFYADNDGDGFGAGDPVEACDAPEGHATEDGDCHDGDATVYPGAPELCDGQDNDCDAAVDEEVTTTFYADADGDGYGVDTDTTEACEVPSGYATRSGDCDDTDAGVNPGATEICDGLDNDCDTDTDEGVMTTFYLDTDEDSYGTATQTIEGCSPPEGYAAVAGDCDDEDAAINPGAEEVCDYVDNNCNDEVDEGGAGPKTWYPDLDEDGFGASIGVQSACTGPSGYVDNGDDCDDTNPDINPNAEDIPGNGIDEDCDGTDAPAADLNGDGYPDLVVAQYRNGTDYTINSYVYWGSESGYSNADRTGLPTEGGEMACVADYDQDGYFDILFANYYDGSSYTIESFIYWGGPFGFSASERSEIPATGPRGCVAADLDADGDVDIVLVSGYDGNSYDVDSYVYWNDDGLFSRSNRDALPTRGAWQATARDLDGDGYMELVFANYRGGTGNSPDYTVDSYIYWGSESGYSADDRTGLPGIGSWKAPTIDDLDEDGSPDIIINNYYSGSGYNLNTYIYWGPDYAVDDRTEIPTHGNAKSMVKDLDQDGFKDIAIANYYDGDNSVNSYVYFGSARGYSADFRQSLPTSRAQDLAIGDINGDGYDDITFGVYYDGDYSTTSYVYYGTSQGFFSTYRTALGTKGVRDVELRDLDGDDRLDAVFASFSDGDDATTSFVYWNSSRGISQSTQSSISTWGSLDVASADFDGNGYEDLVFSNYYSGSSYATNSAVLWGSEAGYSNDDRTLLPTLGAREACLGDLNGDGQIDIVFANYYDGSSYTVSSYIYWGTGNGFDGPTELPTVGTLGCLVEDLDGDGDLDIAFANYRNSSTYTLHSYVYWNEDGMFSVAARTELRTIGSRSLAAGDIDGDGYLDLVFGGYYNGSSYTVDSYIYHGSADGFSADDYETLPGSGVVGDPLIADLNQDGFVDVGLPGHYDGNDAVDTFIYWGSSAPFSTDNRTVLSVNRTNAMKAGDLDGDGYTDLVLCEYYDGDDTVDSYVYWGSASGDYTAGNRTTLRMNRSIDVEIADFDRDGNQDLVFATYYDGDHTTNSFVYYGSPTGYSDSQRTSLRTYGAQAVHVADLDHDGFDDIVFAGYYNGSSYSVTSYVYWGNKRGFKRNNRSELSTYTGRQVVIVGDYAAP